MDKTYESAIELLNSRRRTGRPTPENLTTLAGQPDLNPTPKRGKPSIHGMKEWLQLLGHSDTDLDVIHIAGTKGKGSTCMFAESFLQAHRHRTGFPSKIGLYTSPHITYVWERIRINSKPISQACFTGYFFEVWDKLYHCSQIKEETANMPRYLQLLALLTYHVFIREGVRVAIIETHSGGEYDATNVTQNTVVAGIATLGLDHTALLGPKIENISWHKAGIIKRGSRAYSAPQDTAAVPVLERRAAEKGAPLEFVKVDPEFPPPAKSLQPEVQRINCALALAVVRGYLEAKAPKGVAAELTLQDVLDGVEQFSWRGRFQHIVEGDHQWFIDGAHNEMSVQIAAEWFAKIAPDMQK
ncbi:MAG: hypothetical protein M1818_001312 [Claussenomyces sp. TS43310]|nr:MAG: hypothetical protein M1818_001312 [Claussenomyces sp. TS43310]